MQKAALRMRLAAEARRIAEIPTLAALRARLATAALVAVSLTPVSAIASFSRNRVMSGEPTDYPLFGAAGAAILRGQWDIVFAVPANEGGPLELLPYGVARLLNVQGPIGWTAFYSVTITILVFFLALAALAPLRSCSARKSFYVAFGVGALGILTGYLPQAMFAGHPAEVMIPLLWVVGAMLARDRNFIACGVAVGLSVGFEPWGVLGFIVVFVAVAPRLLPTGIAGLVVIAVFYLPFAATGVFRSFEFHWPVFPDTIYGMLVPDLHQFPWSLRVLQSAFAVVAGVGVALLSRRSRYAVWLAPLAVVAARLAADPLLLSYYWIQVAAISLAGLGAAIYVRAWIPAIVALGLIGAFWRPPFAPFLFAVALLLVVVACAVIAGIGSRRALRVENVPA